MSTRSARASHWRRALVVVAGIWLTTSCSDSTGTGPSVAQVTVTPSQTTLSLNSQLQLTATVKDASGQIITGHSIFWGSEDSNAVSVSTDGLVTVKQAGQSVRVAASSGGQSGIAVINTVVTPVARVVIQPPSANVTVGGTVQLTAITYDANNNVLTGRAVIWGSSNPGAATVDMNSGLVNGVAPGNTTITAVCEGQQDSATVSVSSVPVGSIVVAPARDTLVIGETLQLTDTVKDASGNVLSGRQVSWSSANSGVARVDQTSGLVTAVGPGTTTISASAEGKVGNSIITVVVVPVATVTVSPERDTLLVGDNVQLTAVLKDASGNVLSGRTINWSSNHANVATVDGNGNVHAVAPGTATITATSEGKSDTSTIVVIVPPVATVTVAPPLDTLFVDSTLQLTATLRDARGNVLTDRQVDWSTSDNNVASVDRRSGVVRARNPGTATITATSDNNVTGTATIVVEIVPVASVEIDPPSPVGSPTVSLAFGQVQTFNAHLFDVFHDELSGRTVTWRVENQGNQAAVSNCVVRDNSCSVTATLVIGSAWVIASFTQNTQVIEDTAEVTATGLATSPTSSIEVRPKDPKIKIGQSVQLSASVLDADHHPIDTASVIWSSSNGEIASVNSGGLVTGLKRGNSKVVARSQGVSGATMVRVK